MKRAKKPECTDVKKEEKIERCIKDIKSFITHEKAKRVCKFKRLHDWIWDCHLLNNSMRKYSEFMRTPAKVYMVNQ